MAKFKCASGALCDRFFPYIPTYCKNSIRHKTYREDFTHPKLNDELLIFSEYKLTWFYWTHFLKIRFNKCIDFINEIYADTPN